MFMLVVASEMMADTLYIIDDIAAYAPRVVG